MTVELHPFCAMRPKPEHAETIASPPYDVLTSAEARLMAHSNPLSFLRVNKPEIDLDLDIDPHDDQVYAKGRENMLALFSKAYLRDPEPQLYVYQQRMGEHVQAGIVACTSVFDYEADRIKKHELTRADKERDRIRHIETLGAHTGPVFMTYRAVAEIDVIVDRVRSTAPEYDFTSADAIGHTFWVIRDGDQITRLVQLFKQMECIYVADGHHRSAAATAVAATHREREPGLSGQHEVNYFLSVLFPDDQMQILDYNRVVKDLGGLDNAQLLEKVRAHFDVTPSDNPKPDRAHCFGMLLDGQWFRLTAKPSSFDDNDPVRSLDVSILQENLLRPVLGIEDPRTDERIDFVGGIRGSGELERRCREDSAVAFTLYPTSMAQLMAIADAGQIMPPKSTWFEPKLRSGLVVHSFAER